MNSPPPIEKGDQLKGAAWYCPGSLAHPDMVVMCNAPYECKAAAEQALTLEGRYTSWELLPNMRLGTFSHYRDNGHRAYASMDEVYLCHHGEVNGSIVSACWGSTCESPRSHPS